MTESLTVHEFFKRFPDTDACLEHLMEVRHGTSLDCPGCGKHGKFYKVRKRPVYACSHCGHQINPMAGTIFHRSHTPLDKWFYAIYLFTTSRHGVPAKELQRQLGVAYRTAFRMGHQIRKHMARIDGDGGLSGHVEIDETMVGGRRSGGKRGRGAPGKTVVFGMLERAGDVMTRVVPNVRAATLEPIIVENVKLGSNISTDELGSYSRLGKRGYRHAMVNHSAEEWVRGATHTNSIEGFWSRLKNSIRGTHIHVSAKYLSSYLGEFEYRHNLRKNPGLMFARLLLSF